MTNACAFWGSISRSWLCLGFNVNVLLCHRNTWYWAWAQGIATQAFLLRHVFYPQWLHVALRPYESPLGPHPLFRKPPWTLASEAFCLPGCLPQALLFSLHCFILLIACQTIVSWHTFLPPCCLLATAWLNNSGSGNNIPYFLPTVNVG